MSVPLNTPTDDYHERHRTADQTAADRRNTSTSSRSKPGFVKSLLKRAHSAPKKLTILRRRHSSAGVSQPQPINVAAAAPAHQNHEQPLASPPHVTCCHPFVDKLKTMADKQLNKVTHKRSIKRVNLENGERIVLEEPQPILKLRESPKADRRALAAYVEKRDSDEIMEILALDESPSEVRKRRDRSLNRQEETDDVNRVPEVMESVEVKVAIVPTKPTDIKLIEDDGKEPTIAELLEEEFKNDPPIKVPRKEKDHDYEDIENPDEKIVEVVTVVETKAETPEPIEVVEVVDNIEDEIEENVVVEKSDDITITEANEEESSTAVQIAITAASPEADIEQPRLSAVTEVSEPSSDVTENDQDKVPEIKSSLKSRESSVGPDKRVTFSASTEEREIAAEVERREFEDAMAKEDVHLPSFIAVDKRWSNMR